MHTSVALLVLLTSRAADARCQTHSECGHGKWCDDTHNCLTCGDWTGKDMSASITGTTPLTCVHSVPELPSPSTHHHQQQRQHSTSKTIAGYSPTPPPTPPALSQPWSLWCNASGNAACTPMRWLHVPKAGTTFGLSVYRYACSIPSRAHIPSELECATLPDKHPWRRSHVCTINQFEKALVESFPPDRHCSQLVMPFVGHGPAAPTDTGALVAFFRSPLRRAQSALRMMQKESLQGGSAADWNFYKSTGGYTCPAPDGPKKRSVCCSALLQSPPQNTTIAEYYARGGSCVTGCQTKMVLGGGCHQQMLLTAEHVKTACAMVLSPASFRFVGITELWSESIALFHAALGGATAPAELLNTRPGAAEAAANGHEAGAEPTLLAHPNEAADNQLYECARRRMLADAARLLPGTDWERHMRTPPPDPTYTRDKNGVPQYLPVVDLAR